MKYHVQLDIIITGCVGCAACGSSRFAGAASGAPQRTWLIRQLHCTPRGGLVEVRLGVGVPGHGGSNLWPVRWLRHANASGVRFELRLKHGLPHHGVVVFAFGFS